MTVLGRSLVKPPRFAVKPGLVTPSDAHFWRAVTFLAPLWATAGTTTPDVSTQALSNANGGAFAIGPKGPGWRLSASGAGRYLRWPSKRRYHLDGDIAWSIFTAVDITSWTSVTAGPFGAVNSTTLDGLWRLSRANSGPDLAFVWRNGGTNTSAVWLGAWTGISGAGLGFHTFIVTRRPGGIYELFIDGKSLGTRTTTATPVAGAHDVTLGVTGTANTSTSSVFGLYYTAAIWQGRALNAGHARQLHADPFRFLRPGDGARIIYDRATPAHRPTPGSVLIG